MPSPMPSTLKVFFCSLARWISPEPMVLPMMTDEAPDRPDRKVEPMRCSTSAIVLAAIVVVPRRPKITE